jgi:hypothetical protein
MECYTSEGDPTPEGRVHLRNYSIQRLEVIKQKELISSKLLQSPAFACTSSGRDLQNLVPLTFLHQDRRAIMFMGAQAGVCLHSHSSTTFYY